MVVEEEEEEGEGEEEAAESIIFLTASSMVVPYAVRMARVAEFIGTYTSMI